MKKYFRILCMLCAMLLTAQCITAAGLDEFDKSSYSYYLDDSLTCSEETLLTFDGEEEYGSKGSLTEGISGQCLSLTTRRDNGSWQLINTPTGSFHISISDISRQTVKLRVYVSDIDLLVCDHDAVYDSPQTGSGTLFITLSSEKNGVGHAWQHTFYGSGWHDIELSFDCHNVAYNSLEKIDYSDLTSLRIWCSAKGGLELRFDDMRLCTYDNPGYVEPEAPYGGRWLSTCDYNALDGVILTEWYGACFDTENKTQGSSSVALTGYKENVDHRVCIGVNDVEVVYEEDTICFDMYINNPELLGEDWQLRFEHNAQAAHYSVDYGTAISGLVDENLKRTYLKSGWNHFQIPLSSTDVRIGTGYEDRFTNDLSLTLLVFYIAGTGKTERQSYEIKYDNIYVAKTADLKAAKAELRAAAETAEETAQESGSEVAAVTEPASPEDGAAESGSPTAAIIIALLLLAAGGAAALIIIKRRK